MAEAHAHLPRSQCHDPGRCRGRRGDDQRAPQSFRQCIECSLLWTAGKGCDRHGQERCGRPDRRRTRRDRLHERRDRGRQFRDSGGGRSPRGDGSEASDYLRHRARSRAQHLQGAGPPGVENHHPATRPERHPVARPVARCPDRRHGARVDYAREQRNRDHPARDKACKPRPRARSPVSHRRGPERGQDSGERAGAWRRSAGHVGP